MQPGISSGQIWGADAPHPSALPFTSSYLAADLAASEPCGGHCGSLHHRPEQFLQKPQVGLSGDLGAVLAGSLTPVSGTHGVPGSRVSKAPGWSFGVPCSELGLSRGQGLPGFTNLLGVPVCNLPLFCHFSNRPTCPRLNSTLTFFFGVLLFSKLSKQFIHSLSQV